jgi:nitroreductase
MDCLEAIEGRRSIRKFKDSSIGKEEIKELLKAAQMAPSAGNLQARDFIVVSEKRIIKQLAKAAFDQLFVEQAPIVIVAMANIERSSLRYGLRGELYAIQDATASVMNLLLAAYSKGLSTCWVGAFDENAVCILLGLPHKIKPIAIIPIGYSDEKPNAPPRMELDRAVHWETW